MDPGHFNPGASSHAGGCFTCRYGGAEIPRSSSLEHRRAPYSKPHTWPATFPDQGCSGWEREPGSDDEIRPAR